jgi:hypothetical protein
MAVLIERLERSLPISIEQRTKDSINWFRKNLRQIKLPPRRISKEFDEYVDRVRLGRLYMFFYDPKTKDKLPYWDAFPLVFPIKRQRGGFLGINLHYIAPRYRAVLFTNLMEYLNNEEYDETTRLRLTYDVLNSVGKLRYHRPCLKRYLYGHINSKIKDIPPNDWEVVTMIPSQQFTENANTVYADSKRKF